MRFLVLTALVTFSAAASAQPGTWLPVSSGSDMISVTSSHIVFDNDSFSGGSFSSLSNASFLEARFGRFVQVVADLPVAYAAVDRGGIGVEDGSFVLGNPYIGVEASLPSGVIVGIGGRAPVVETLIELNPDDVPAVVYGITATSDRLGAYNPETATLAGTLGFEYVASPDVAVTARIVPQVLIPTANTDLREVELFASYSVQLQAYVGPASLSVGARGTGIVTEDAGNASRFDHFVGIAGELPLGGLRPGIYAEIPVGGDVGNSINAIVGIGLGIDLN